MSDRRSHQFRRFPWSYPRMRAVQALLVKARMSRTKRERLERVEAYLQLRQCRE